MTTSEQPVRHDPPAMRFVIQLPAGEGLLTYSFADSRTLDLEYTFVPPSARGEGVGARLAKAALEFARAREYRVIPSCSFIQTYLIEHPEYRDLEAP